MSDIQLCAANRLSTRLQAGIKLAHLLELPEDEFESRIHQIEAHPLFRRLSVAGVLSIHPLPRARYMGRTFEDRQLRASDGSLADLLDGDGGIARLIRRVGRRKFQECFLGDEALSDKERAIACGISRAQAKRLREFVDRLYVRSEFGSHENRLPPVEVYSTVAGIELQDGRPVIGFFNRKIWKGRYVIDEARRRELKATLTPEEAARIERFLRQVELLSFRQTTLYRVLETLVEVQAAYLATGDPGQRRPLTQREVAARLEVTPSVLSRMIANKSIEAPWRLEIPLKALFPSRKTLLRDRLYDIAMERPEDGDDALREEVRRLYGTGLSRSSIIQYRKELGLGGRGQRDPACRTNWREEVLA